ncbi:hypothetical protein E2C01_070856 [Portunus trituberculatus]|uniref:Secreted protein n=1 Tax=Portunus trituberculatus TaxID=210409 RepID=A0A5B7I2R8_PORTR|nr:hypothetical protein [Portunus trituberculatus]
MHAWLVTCLVCCRLPPSPHLPSALLSLLLASLRSCSADHLGQCQETPRRSSSSSSSVDKKRQRRKDNVPRGEVKKRKENAGSTPQQRDDAVAGPSGHNVNSAAGDANYERRSCLLGSLIEKL